MVATTRGIEGVPTPGNSFFQDGKIHVPIEDIEPYQHNPRDPVEMDYDKSGSFRRLVASLMEFEGNLIPLSGFYDSQISDRTFFMREGHRRLAAAKKVNELFKKGHSPIEITSLHVVLRDAKISDYERISLQFSEESTTQRWNDVRRFKHFRMLFDKAPQQHKKDIKSLQSRTSLSPELIRRYVEMIKIPPVADAMENVGNSGDALPRSGRDKTCRSITRAINLLMRDRSTLVKDITGYDTKVDSGNPARNELAKLLLKKAHKYVHLRKNSQLAVGHSHALERTLPVLSPKSNISATSEEIRGWLLNDSPIVLSQTVIEETHNRIQDGKASTISELVRSYKSNKLNLKEMSIEEANKYKDDILTFKVQLTDEVERIQKYITREIEK